MRIAFGNNMRSVHTYGIILWGLPHTGKSHDAVAFCKAKSMSFFPLPEKQNDEQNHWFDGYEGQDVLIVNEMSGATFKPDFFCRLLDSQPMLVPVKGGYTHFNSKLIIFTSNKHPQQWWSSAVMDKYPGLLRRLSPPITETRFYDKVVPADIVVTRPAEFTASNLFRGEPSVIPWTPDGAPLFQPPAGELVITTTGCHLSTFRPPSSFTATPRPSTSAVSVSAAILAPAQPRANGKRKAPSDDDDEVTE